MRKALLARSSLLVAAVANLILAAMCVLSGAGQTQIVTVDVRGESFQVRVDGIQATPDARAAPDQYASLNIPETGTIALSITPPIPSLPDPQGIDSVVVRDSDGAVLFRDDFDSLDPDKWQIASGDFKIEDGVLVARSQPAANTLELRDSGWRDYMLEVRFRNGGETELAVRRSGSGGLFYHVWLIRDFPTRTFAHQEDGAWTGDTYGALINTGKRGSVTSVVAMVVGSYPLPLLALAAGGLVAALLAVLEHVGSRALPGLANQVQGRAVRPFIRKAAWPAVVLALAVGAFGVTAHIMWHYYERVPHLPDEASYIFQAKLFAAGRLSAAVPSVKEAFHVWEPINWLYERDGHWSTVYPPGHPLVLALGAALGAMWLVPPLLGGACVVLVGLVGRKLYDPVTGLLASLLLAASPFFLMQSANFMSHITWVFFLLMSLLFMIQRDRTLLFGALAGLFFGLALNTRAVEAVMIMPPLAIALAWPLVRQETRPEAAGRCFGVLAGGAVAILLMLLYNAILAGDPLTLPYHGSSGVRQVLGFSNGHTLSIGLRNMQALAMALVLILNGWPAFVGLTLVLLPFLLGTRNPWDYFCGACVVLLTSIYLLYRYAAGDGGLFEGPRYWFQAMPFLMLLSARGAVLGAGFIGAMASKLRAGLTGDRRPARWAGAAVVAPVLLLLIADGTGGWLFGWNKDWLEGHVPQVQNEINGLHNVYGVDNRLVKLQAELNLKNALIFVPGCGFDGSNLACYDTVFNENSLDFNGDVVWARNVPDLNERVIQAYPGRDVYVATWEPPSIVRYEPEPPLGAETP
jgi:Dolichyl-phosphate-mannose-protein mannosyltransferase